MRKRKRAQTWQEGTKVQIWLRDVHSNSLSWFFAVLYDWTQSARKLHGTSQGKTTQKKWIAERQHASWKTFVISTVAWRNEVMISLLAFSYDDTKSFILKLLWPTTVGNENDHSMFALTFSIHYHGSCYLHGKRNGVLGMRFSNTARALIRGLQKRCSVCGYLSS